MTTPTTAIGPFLDLGFTTVKLEPKNENGNLGFDINGRQRGQVHQRLEGEVDPAGRGVIIGTIELVPREDNPYAGMEEIGTSRWQIPEAVAQEWWHKVVAKGETRWEGIVGAKPRDTTALPALVTAERQNELIYALVLLANQVSDLGIGPNNPLRYVRHRHVISVDGGLIMAYGRATRGWQTQDMIYMVNGKPTEPMLALVGISSASFVQFLIEQFGHRLGISRLVSITVSRMGLDVSWNFA
jgi:hypothetical protein